MTVMLGVGMSGLFIWWVVSGFGEAEIVATFDMERQDFPGLSISTKNTDDVHLVLYGAASPSVREDAPAFALGLDAPVHGARVHVSGTGLAYLILHVERDDGADVLSRVLNLTNRTWDDGQPAARATFHLGGD